jgi:FkbM family methyltransferase
LPPTGVELCEAGRAVVGLDPSGFNELRRCRAGPMIYNSHDAYVGRSLQMYGEYSYGETLLFMQIVKPGDLVVEVGANIGAHSVDLARLVGPEGELHAFEPQRIAFQTLCANLALNQCANVRTWPMALGSRPGMAHVPALDPSAPQNFAAARLIDEGAGEPVTMQTLDALDLPSCSFVKVDVEGMETAVLEGARETIATYRPLLYVENDRDETSGALIALVESLGYVAHWHVTRLFNPLNFYGELHNVFPSISSINMLCVPRETQLDVPSTQPVVAGQSWRDRFAGAR